MLQCLNYVTCKAQLFYISYIHKIHSTKIKTNTKHERTLEYLNAQFLRHRARQNQMSLLDRISKLNERRPLRRRRLRLLQDELLELNLHRRMLKQPGLTVPNPALPRRVLQPLKTQVQTLTMILSNNRKEYPKSICVFRRS